MTVDLNVCRDVCFRYVHVCFFQSEIRYSSLGKHFLDQKQSGFVAMSIQ